MNGCILVLDDDPIMTRLLTNILSLDGHDVDVASSGREALERSAEKRYDVIFTDKLMPGMDGIEFIRQIRDRDAAAHPTIIVLSGSGIDLNVMEELEVFDVIAKPFPVARIRSAARRALAHRLDPGDDPAS